MVSEKKIKIVKELKDLLDKYSVIGILNMHGMPARQLFEIRNKMRGDAVIIMVKKNLIKIAISGTKKKNIENVSDHLKGEPALLLSNMNPFKIYRYLEENKMPGNAKEGDVLPKDVIIPTGITQFPAGPMIGEFQRMKIKTKVEDGKIAVVSDTKIASAGDLVTKELAEFISKFGIKPMEIGLNLVCAFEEDLVFDNAILNISVEEYLKKIRNAHSNYVALSIGIDYPTKDSIKFMIKRTYNAAKHLGVTAKIYEKDVVEMLLLMASQQKNALQSKMSGVS